MAGFVSSRATRRRSEVGGQVWVTYDPEDHQRVALDLSERAGVWFGVTSPEFLA